jgi:hypothetical protein
MTKPEEATPAGSAPFERDVGRPVPERDVFDYEAGDEDWLDDERDDECPRCHGDGMDPWNDYLFACPECGGRDSL